MAMVGIGESGGWHFLRLETFQFVVDQCPICRCFLGGGHAPLVVGGNVSIPYKHVAQSLQGPDTSVVYQGLNLISKAIQNGFALSCFHHFWLDLKNTIW